jgi:hypothetical protein
MDQRLTGNGPNRSEFFGGPLEEVDLRTEGASDACQEFATANPSAGGEESGGRKAAGLTAGVASFGR